MDGMEALDGAGEVLLTIIVILIITITQIGTEILTTGITTNTIDLMDIEAAMMAEVITIKDIIMEDTLDITALNRMIYFNNRF